MNFTRRSFFVYGLLIAVWALVVVWQVEEHIRVREAAKADLSGRSKEIANTLSGFIRALRYRNVVSQDRLQLVLNELVNGHTNELIKSSERIVSIVLINAANEPLVSADKPVEPKDILQAGEQRWGAQ